MVRIPKDLKGRLLFHHGMALEHVRYGVYVPDPAWSDPDFREAYMWLEGKLGFWPAFVAVGDSLEAFWHTGYHSNWQRATEWRGPRTTLRKAGEFPNNVMFSFDHVDGVFMDHELWHFPLNDCGMGREIKPDLVKERWIFKPAWSRTRWLRHSLDPEATPVQLVCPQLDLRAAKRVWVRNKATKRTLEAMGFTGVAVHRIRVPWW
ncbi:MAG: hypothetical protein JW889_15810 [Verrucomicrobia bacterium]|nr:hypothetical protein [Verrucomicrobiota bacterium]